jgi:hypothetical protein
MAFIKKQGESGTFTAAVQGKWGTPPQTVTWSVTGGTKGGTAIDASTGALTIAADEPHATVLTVTATSTADTSTSGTAQVTAVSVMPSALYGTWVWQSSWDSTHVITADKFRRDDTDGVYHEKALTSWEAAVNTTNFGETTYPAGYKVTGTEKANKGSSFVDNLTFFLMNDGGAYCMKNGDDLIPRVFNKQQGGN